MKLITCCSFKGGAGKTTALMGLCSVLAMQGKTIALFEADENRPLTRWKENAVKRNTWDDRCEVFVADDLPLLENAYDEAAARKFDYALADTHGGSSELNNTIIASSNFLLVPTMLTPLDVDEALATYRYIIELLLSENLVVPTAILQQRVPIGRLTTSQRKVSDMLTALPLTKQPMFERDAFAAMKDRGMLHLSLRNARVDPGMRLMLRNLDAAMEDLRLLSHSMHEALEQ
ncbi:conjugal transfer ATPase VirC1 [Rhizobium sp. NFACC06-2]|uniref:conjugal transfer ATPase VirC1 n=1 Tax=Rhizobium sp. NFACC06-2 TaxID=1566264 RepID=UPI0008773E59|nr:conjugal transfer ATPase VirC1 [Rhizobium sp. NFACC06-2]SCY90402.1 Cellulose biosynthesis protein BcsQ [Rhizobium sp. NFACC06-2]